MRTISKSPSKHEGSKPPETESEHHKAELDLVSKSSMDDLAEWVSSLTIELTRLQDRTRPSHHTPMSSPWHCYMCERDSHGIQDCPEMRALIGAGMLKFDGPCLVMADGSQLPCSFRKGMPEVIRYQPT